jgi:RimJ/RimL family protein N-acetyltransferase
VTNDNILYGERVRLTALTADDLTAVGQWYEDSCFVRHLDAPPAKPRTENDLKKWMEKMQESSNDYLFAIRPIDGDDLLGFVELDGVLWSHGVCGLSIGIAPARQGEGHGQEAMRLALRFAFDELNLHRVQLTVFSYNARAIALYEKLGFTHEGTFREFLHRDSRRHDMHLYGLLRREWEAQQSEN